jgi:hypothetical protein
MKCKKNIYKIQLLQLFMIFRTLKQSWESSTKFLSYIFFCMCRIRKIAFFIIIFGRYFFYLWTFVISTCTADLQYIAFGRNLTKCVLHVHVGVVSFPFSTSSYWILELFQQTVSVVFFVFYFIINSISTKIVWQSFK